MTILQSTLNDLQMFHTYPETDIQNLIKNSRKKETVIIRDGDACFKLEGSRNECSKTPVEVRVVVKKPVTDQPRLTEDEKLNLFKEWYNANHRNPNPGEMYNNLCVDKYYREYYKRKAFVDKLNSVIQPN